MIHPVYGETRNPREISDCVDVQYSNLEDLENLENRDPKSVFFNFFARNALFRKFQNIPVVGFSSVRREIYYIRLVRLFDGLAEIAAPRRST